MIANVEGLFSKMAGSVQLDPPGLNQLSVDAEIEVKSLTTGHPERDEHLLSADYFDHGKYPKIFFKSTKVEPTASHRGKVTGDLTMRGIKHPITLDFEFFGPVRSPFSGKSCIGFSATGKVNREEYGMTWNEVMEGGGVVMGKEIQIQIEVEADLTEG